MACAPCAKNRARPLGPQAPTTETARSGQNTARVTRVPPLGTNRTQTFSLMLPSGEMRYYDSRLEAEAERVRSAGGVVSVL